MNLSYFRKSKRSYDETVKHLKKQLKAAGANVLGETTLPNDTGVIVYFGHPTWTGNLMAADKNLIGLLPAAIAVTKKDNEVSVGGGSAAVLSGVTPAPAVKTVADAVDKALKEIIHTASDVGALKPTKVKLYSTTTCPYCKAEKAWLEEKNIEHEMVLVDQDQKEAEQMVQKTGQMGVPVTEIQFEDADAEYIVGFDKNRLTDVLGISPILTT